MVIDESPGSTQSLITAITHDHGGRVQLADIRRRDAMDSCLLGSRPGESTSMTRDLTVSQLDHHLQAGDNLLRRFKSVRALTGHWIGFCLESDDLLLR